MISIKSAYEKRARLNEEMDNLLDKKKSLIIKVKALDEEDPEVETEINDVNDKLQDVKSQLEDIIKQIDQYEDSVKQDAEEVKPTDNGEDKMTKQYLDTKMAVKDFAGLLISTGGGEALRNAWVNKVKSFDASATEALLPTPLVTEINSALEGDGSLFAALTHTKFDGHKVVVDTTPISAKGHKIGNEKVDTEVTSKVITINTDAIYQYLTIDAALTHKSSADAILEYVMNDLPNKLIRAMERAVVTGDGLAKTNKDHITSFEAITDSELTEKITAKNDAEFIEELYSASALLTDAENPVMVISTKTLNKIKKQKTTDGAWLFPVGFDVNAVFDVNNIYAVSWMKEDEAVVFDTKAYEVDMNERGIETFQNFVLKYNQNEFLIETFAGGALVKANKAVYIKKQAA